jgi:hypothetical protein
MKTSSALKMVAVGSSKTWVLTYQNARRHVLIYHLFKEYDCFQTNLEQGNLSAETVGEYRVLWLRLSGLISDTGRFTSVSLRLVG